VPEPSGRRSRGAAALTPANSPVGDLAWRVLRLAFGLVGRYGLGFRLELLGAEHLPRDEAGRPVGGWIAVGVPHVTWIEPFVMLVLLPSRLRLTWFGDGRVLERSAWRRMLLPRLGRVEPIWPGGGPDDFAQHVDAVERTVRRGDVFALFPERGHGTQPGRARPFAPGIGYFALRTGVPIVPIVFGGTHELYRGRRIRAQVLPPLLARDLAAEASLGGAVLDERDAARAVAALLGAMVADAVAAAHRATEPPPGAAKRWRWLTHAFR
jgi:1-acyl-sn-glycerol-3-phosphate acyltransferase